MSNERTNVVYGTEDILTSLCNSVTRVLNVATQTKIHYSAMVQRITKIGLKPDIGCFVLFDGGFSGLVVLNFSGGAALEIYERYMLSMGMPKSELASVFTSDEVSNILGELMNQIVGDFTGKVRRELQTNITQNQPKMLVLNKQVMLSVDTPLDRPEIRRVSFFTENNNIFYMELAIDRTEFIKLHDFDSSEILDPDALLDMEQANPTNATNAGNAAPAAAQGGDDDSDELLRSLGM
jgi:CheY-specific phosphatase CheX